MYNSEPVLSNQQSIINSKLKRFESQYYSQTYKLRNYTQRDEIVKQLLMVITIRMGIVFSY